MTPLFWWARYIFEVLSWLLKGEIMKLTLRALLLSISCLMFITANASQSLDKQIFIMRSAYNIAKEDGHKDPSILQGIVMVETGAGTGKMISPSGSIGVSQILIGTAKYVLLKFPTLSSKYFPTGFTKSELYNKLLQDHNFNMRVASKYLLLMGKENHLAGDRLILAYNRGPGGAMTGSTNSKYVNDVKRYARSELAVTSQKTQAGPNQETNEFTFDTNNVIIDTDDDRNTVDIKETYETDKTFSNVDPSSNNDV